MTRLKPNERKTEWSYQAGECMRNCMAHMPSLYLAVSNEQTRMQQPPTPSQTHGQDASTQEGSRSAVCVIAVPNTQLTVPSPAWACAWRGAWARAGMGRARAGPKPDAPRLCVFFLRCLRSVGVVHARAL